MDFLQIGAWVLFLLLNVYGHRPHRLRHSQIGNQQEPMKPNIIFIMADDLGWNDVGFHNPLVRTPHIDQMARDGIELTSYYTQTMCSPSRSALMTGRYPSQNGLQQMVVVTQARNCLPLEWTKLLPESMREADYVTKLIGKWHLGNCHSQCLPTNRGFDEYRGIITGGANYFTWDTVNDLGLLVRYMNETPSFDQLGTHHSLIEKSDVTEIIATHKQYHNDKPLFLIVSPTAPHTPYQVTENMFNIHDTLTETNQTERRKFLGLVSALDDIVGETIQSLKDAGLYNNSIIIFTSDNGGANKPDHKGRPSSGNNYPLRGQKRDYYEGGIRAPTVYLDTRLPSYTRGTRRDFLMHITDWYPTFLGLANSDEWIDEGINGRDQRSNLRARFRSSRKYRTRKGMLIGITDMAVPLSTICADSNYGYRYKDWKLIMGDNYRCGDGDYLKPAENTALPTLEGDTCIREEDGKTVIRCLFNIKNDPSEQRNLYDSKPDIVRRITARIDYWRRSRVQAVFDVPDKDINNIVQFGNHNVTRVGFCNPVVDFPLQPVQNPTCFPNI